MAHLISPTPALNSHQGQPRNKIRVKIDFEKEQERLEHVEIAKLRQISGATRFWANLENLATLQRLELLRKFPAKTEENPENHENFFRSSVCVFMILVGLRMWSRAGQPKIALWTVFKKIIIFLSFPGFSFAGKVIILFWPLSAKTWEEMPGVFDNSQNFFVGVFLGPQVGRPWPEQVKNPENILRKISPENFRRCKLSRVFFSQIFLVVYF